MNCHGRTNLICMILSLFLLVTLGGLFYWNFLEEEKDSEQLIAIAEKQREEQTAKEKALAEKETNNSFYQKLSDGSDVDVLIVGDSIGAGAGAQTKNKQWFEQLQFYLHSTYKVSVGLTNVSMGGNTSYAGYVRTMLLDYNSEKPIDYDLAVICFGQNDSMEGFSTNYESVIRAIEAKYPNCSIISILQSSQKEYTAKMTEIQTIADSYGIPVADTIAPFIEGPVDYDLLTNDGVHPNDTGQNIYFKVVKNVIDEHVKISTGKMIKADAINDDVHKLDNFAYYGVDEFTRKDNTFTISCQNGGILGIDYTYQSGKNKADIYIDGEFLKSPMVNFDYDFSQRHILVVSEDVKVDKEIKIVFDSAEQADGFYGVCFSWK